MPISIAFEVVDLGKGGGIGLCGGRKGEGEFRIGDFLRFLSCLDFGGVSAEGGGRVESERVDALRVVGGEDCSLGVFAMVCVSVVLCEERVGDMVILLWE